MESRITGSAPAVADEAPEVEIVRLACDGDSSAFERLYRLHSRRVYGLCYRIAGNRIEAEDLTQDAFLQVFRKLHTFRGESSFSTWVHRLAFNVALARLRKKRIPEISLDSVTEPSQEISHHPVRLRADDLRLNGVLDRVRLSKAIDRLPAGYREIFLLHDVEGYKHEEIAEIWGCSVGNSKSQLFKARLRLRELLYEDARIPARNKQSQ